MIEYKPILSQNNFQCYHVCSCRGTREERYRHKTNRSVEFVIFPARQNMETRINRVIVCRTGIDNLQSEIDKYIK